MNRLVARCPVCSDGMEVTEVTCNGCGTQVRSRFATCRFCQLQADQSQFLETFLRSRGNLSSIGEEMGISYPTVVKRLESLLGALFQDTVPAPSVIPSTPNGPSPEQRRMTILEKLDRGELTAEEATRMLRDL